MNFFNFSPLEQFQLYMLNSSINFNFSIYFAYNIIFLIFLYLSLFFFKYNIIFSKFLVKLISLIENILKENCFNLRKYFLLLLANIFILFLIINIVGLIPYSFTLTSHLFFTLFFAFFFFLSINILLIINWFIKSLNLFFPSGVPLFISPLLILIEIISYFGRLISLSVRLFANMLSGHALLKILIGNFLLVFIGVFVNQIFLIFFIFYLILLFILFLETAVAFLQSYVFSLMLVLYYSDVLEFH